MNEHIQQHWQFVYNEQLNGRLTPLHTRYHLPTTQRTERFSHKDAILITYGDMVQNEGERPLTTLYQFLQQKIAGLINTIHILPFYPYSSDDGFSVIDYKQVDPALGHWQDIRAFRQEFRLMFDAVINHISAQSDWFQQFQADHPQYRDYFTVIDPNTDLSEVFRPRALPLLTPVHTPSGRKHVWTTFSADQIDLNYANPTLLLDVLDVLLFYVSQGADLIRLDAIAFMWKEIGTNSLHRPQAHRLIQLMRSVLDEVAPHVALITETNVPHEDNISYFGDGTNEAQMVYNFSLPPLTLHAFQTGQATYLTKWAKTLTLPSDQVTFFNFLASHDGIGVTPARGILPHAEITKMAERVEAWGGYVSYKNNADGSQSAYELNISYIDALGEPTDDMALISQRFITAQAIMLALRGIPGIYFHSLFGSQSWRAGAETSGRARTINRQKLTYGTLHAELEKPDSLRHRVFEAYKKLLTARTNHPAFHPTGEQEIIASHSSVFGVKRWVQDGETAVLCLHNVSNQPVQQQGVPTGRNLITGQTTKKGAITLAPYDYIWLEIKQAR